jgi:hypothetical protein
MDILLHRLCMPYPNFAKFALQGCPAACEALLSYAASCDRCHGGMCAATSASRREPQYLKGMGEAKGEGLS